MAAEKVENIIKRLEKLMYGHNYQVKFGVNLFEDCYNFADFRGKLKQIYKDSRPDTVQPIPLTEKDLWEDIDFAFRFRGDSSAGLALSESKASILEKEQAKYKAFIKQFIDEEANIYSYPDDEGIPAYAVFWDFRFIIFAKENKCLFIFGAASD